MENGDNNIFAYGQEVDDFHSIEPNMIFTITTTAVKELDKELQELKEMYKRQETRIQKQEEEINELKKLVDAILKKE